MKGTNDVDSPVVWMPRLLRPERRLAFMLLVHKFPVNGARMSRRPPFCVLPPLSSPFPASSKFSRSFIVVSLPLFYSSRFRALSDLFYLGSRRPDPPLCEITRLFTKASPKREDDTWRNFWIYWPRGRLPPILWHRRLVPMSSRKKQGGKRCPINLCEPGASNLSGKPCD